MIQILFAMNQAMAEMILESFSVCCSEGQGSDDPKHIEESYRMLFIMLKNFDVSQYTWIYDLEYKNLMGRTNGENLTDSERMFMNLIIEKKMDKK